jgi:hypothetical protein
MGGRARGVGIAIGIFAEAGHFAAATRRGDRNSGQEAAKKRATQSSFAKIFAHISNPRSPSFGQ